jgi:hypothetical protein
VGASRDISDEELEKLLTRWQHTQILMRMITFIPIMKSIVNSYFKLSLGPNLDEDLVKDTLTLSDVKRLTYYRPDVEVNVRNGYMIWNVWKVVYVSAAMPPFIYIFTPS